MQFTELIFVIVFSTLLILDIVGNTLVILVILKYRAMKTPMNYLLLNLAVADIMVGTFFSPNFLFTESLLTHPTGTVGDILCKTLTGRNLSWVASLASGLTLVCVAVERFYAVVHPTSIRHKITTRKLKRIVPACWIIATVTALPAFLCKSVYLGDSGWIRCRTVFKAHWQYVTYELLWLINAGIVPVILMTVLYSRVVYTLWIKDGRDDTRLAVIKARKRITQKCITVSVIFALCVLPVNVLYLVYRLHPNVFIYGDGFFKTGYCLLVLNSLVNPFVYTFQCEKFRKYLKRLICNARRVHPQEAVHH